MLQYIVNQAAASAGGARLYINATTPFNPPHSDLIAVAGLTLPDELQLFEADLYVRAERDGNYSVSIKGADRWIRINSGEEGVSAFFDLLQEALWR